MKKIMLIILLKKQCMRKGHLFNMIKAAYFVLLKAVINLFLQDCNYMGICTFCHQLTLPCWNVWLSSI